MDEGFLAMPSMAIKGNRVVVAIKDEYELLKLDGKLIAPERLAQGLFEHFGAVHILDVDGYLNESPHLGLIQRICEMGELWVDGGSRVGDGVIDIMMAGASKAVVCTKCIDGLREVANACELSEDIVFQIDNKKGVVAANKALAKMDLDEIIDEVMDLGITKFIFADIAAQEKGKGPDPAMLKKILEKHKGIELIAAGGVKAEHVAALKEAGIAGAILDLRSCIEAKKISF